MDTVRGRIDLDGRDALREMQRLRQEGVLTARQFEDIGRALDQVGDREDERRFRRLGGRLRDLARTSRTSGREYRRGWEDATRAVERSSQQQQRAIGAVENRMESLGRRRAEPQVDLDGVTAALAQVQLLNRQLDILDRRRVNPRIGMAGGGGGGGRGGGLTGRIGTESFGVAGRISAGVALGALPVANTVVGATGAILGSAGAAALGAGALGATGFAGAGVGMAGTMLAGKGAASAIKGVTEAQKAQKEAQTQLNAAISEFGSGSEQAAAAAKEAAAAQRTLTRAYEAAPEGTERLLQRVKLLQAEFREQTRPGQDALTGAASRSVLAGRRGLRRFGADAINRVSTESAQ